MAATKSPKEKKAKDASRAANASKVSADESSAKQDVAPVDGAEKEQLEQVLKDLPDFEKLLIEFAEKADEARKHIEAITEQIRSKELAVEKGLSFLEVKLHLLVSYCVDIAFVMLLKTEPARPFAGHPIIDHLLELRAFIEKIRPLDSKLRNQIEKLVRMAAVRESTAADGSDPLAFRPNPDALVSKAEDAAEAEGEEEGGEQDASGVYVPPRIAAVHYDDTATNKRKKKEDREARKMRDSELYRELREEFTEEPVEIKDYSRLFAGEVYNRAEQERQLRFEEENFKRLAETKQQKKARKAVKFRNELDELTKFGNFSRVASRGQQSSNTDELDRLQRKKSLKEYMAAEKKTKKSGPPRKKHKGRK